MTNAATPSASQPRVGVTAIASVEWVTRSESGTRNPGTSTAADLAKLEAHDGAYRTFPEKTEPDTFGSNGNIVTASTNYDKVEVRVSLAAAIPTGMTGSIRFKIFDPKNAQAEISPSVFLPDPDDNYGTMTFSNGGNTHYVYNSDGTYFSKGFAIDLAHAGDNYIVAAHPNGGVLNNYRFYTKEDAIATGYNPNNLPLNKVATSLMNPNLNVTTTSLGNPPVGYAFLTTDTYQKYHQTSVLTVWRTLWVELDQMEAPDSLIPEYAGMSQPPKPDISLVKDAMEAACVDVREATPAIIESWGINSRETVTFVDVLEGYAISEDCRDITLAQVTNEFWLVHGIGACKNNQNDFGLLWSSFFVFTESIREATSMYPSVYSGGFTGQIARTTYHEIMHLFGFFDVYDVDALFHEIIMNILNEEYPGVYSDFPEWYQEELYLTQYLWLYGILNEKGGDVNRFIVDARITCFLPENFNVHSYLGYDDPRQGVMNYSTLHYGGWWEIQLKPHQIQQIQSWSKPD